MKKLAMLLPVAFAFMGTAATAEVKEGVEYKFLECSESYGVTFRANLLLENGDLYIVNNKTEMWEPTFKLPVGYFFMAREGYEMGIDGDFTTVGPRGDTYTNQATYMAMYELTDSREPQTLSLMHVGISFELEGETKHDSLTYSNCTVNNKGMLFDYAPQR